MTEATVVISERTFMLLELRKGHSDGLCSHRLLNHSKSELTIPFSFFSQHANLREDSWINATHILKIAGVEKGRRTKVLEKEVHHEPHEKIQGGFGKYQGTWVPLDRAKNIAEQFGVGEYLSAILNV